MIKTVTDFDMHPHFVLASEIYRGKFRKGTRLPYLVHPVQVTALLGEWGISCVVTWLGGLYHDGPEECPTFVIDQLYATGKKVDRPMLDRVWNLGQELTFIPDPKSDQPVKIQKRAYLRTWLERDEKGHFSKSVESLVIKIADRVCNVRDFMSSDLDYALTYFEYASCLFQALETRKSEIVEAYGLGVWTAMRHTVTVLRKSFS